MNAHSRGVSSVRHRDSLGIGTRIRAKLDFVLRPDARATPKNVACDKPTDLRKLDRLFSGRAAFLPAFFYHGQCFLNRVKSSDCSVVEKRRTTLVSQDRSLVPLVFHEQFLQTTWLSDGYSLVTSCRFVNRVSWLRWFTTEKDVNCLE